MAKENFSFKWVSPIATVALIWLFAVGAAK
jgi:hypothetical protein